MHLKREPNELDLMVGRFAKELEEDDIKYAVVAGYVAVALGRPRTTEDVDFIVVLDDAEKLRKVMGRAGFESLTDLNEFYTTSARFYLPPKILPNIEVKKAKTSHHFYAVENRIRLSICGKVEFYIGPLEHQIAYKLYLGSPKDLEDAYFIWEATKDLLEWGLIEQWAKELGVEDRLWYLKE